MAILRVLNILSAYSLARSLRVVYSQPPSQENTATVRDSRDIFSVEGKEEVFQGDKVFV